MTSLAIVGGAVLTEGDLGPKTLTIDENLIEAVAEPDPGSGDSGEPPLIDATGLVVAPGFVDLQINGGFGFDLLTDPTSMWDLGRLLPVHGVTGFLPTIITSAKESTDRALAAIHERPESYLGAEPLGLHFEGPMINARRAGAHDVEHIVVPTLAVIEDWSRANGLALVTLAPELDIGGEVTSALRGRGVRIAAGHSMASVADARAGVAAGIEMVTHLFNAMAPLGHREPNLAGFALSDIAIRAGLIADGVHVDPTMVAAAWNAKGPNGIVLVSDAVAAMGKPAGDYLLGERAITSDGSSVRNRDGTLAGSVLTMDQAVRNIIEFTGCSTVDALTASSRTPANAIGESQRGSLRPGLVADLVLLDQHLAVQLTICAGRICYAAESAKHRVPDELLEGL